MKLQTSGPGRHNTYACDFCGRLRGFTGPMFMNGERTTAICSLCAHEANKTLKEHLAGIYGPSVEQPQPAEQGEG